MKFIKLSFIIFILSTATVLAQKTVNGKVTDSNGIPIPGANILVKGSSNGTMTDFYGVFVIENVKASNVLVFSYIGFESVEIKVSEQETINVKLKTDISELDEIVIIGYDSVKKKDLTGSVSTIKAADLNRTPTANFDQALAGRAAGVQVSSTDGTPGSALNIVIRGGNSITGDNSPLYVIDGIPFEDFDPSSISTRDIKSFDVLKDASATAIYGSRGANGVILITTFDGRSDGKYDISINSSIAVQYIPNRLEVLGPYDYVKYQEAVAYANDSYVPGENVRIFETTWIDPELYRNVKGIDFQDEVFRTAYLKNNNVSIRGGDKKTSIFFSAGIVDQEGTLINTGFKKYNNRLKISSQINDDLNIKAQMVYSNANQPGINVRGDSFTSLIKNIVSFRPVRPINPVFDEESNLQDLDPFLFDPVLTIRNTGQKRSNEEFATTLSLDYEFLSKFTLSLKGNYWTRTSKRSTFYDANTQQAQRTFRGINGTVLNSKNNTLSTSNTLRFKDRKNSHRYGFLLGMEAQYRNVESSSLRNTNIPIDAFGIDNLGIATGATIANTDYSENALLSYFSRLNYSYKDKYLATVNFRTDGSSKFRKENRWGYFPSFSLAWRASKEDFIRSINAISDLKFRAGWGLTGNNRIGDFDAYNQFSVNASSGYILGTNQEFVPGAFQSRMAVPDLRWETTAQTNLGIDLSLFKKIDLTIDYYFKRTKDLLLLAEMSPSTGFDRVQQNVGEVTNQGLEITLNTKNINTENFKWNTSFNISFNRTNTVKLNSGQLEILTDPEWDRNFIQTEFQYVTRVGNPVGMIYGLEFDGIYQVEDFVLTNGGSYQLKDGIPGYRSQMQPGMVKFRDQLTVDTNGDGIPDAGDGSIDENDRKIIGNPQPKHIGGIFNDFTYKQFDLQILLNWAFDFDILNANKSEFGSVFQSNRNGFTSLNDIWTPTNTDTNIGGVRYNGVNLNAPFGYKLDTRHIDDGSYLRLKTVAIGYNLPDDVLEKLKIKKMRISISAQNLVTWTSYTGYDPDVSVGRFGALTPALDFSAYPQSATISGGIELTF